MLTSDPERERPRPARQRGGRATDASLDNEGLATFRRAYRWLNLTLIQQGIWPLLVVMAGAPAALVGLTPLPWYWARLGAPLLAALLARAYLAQMPEGLPGDPALRQAQASGDRDGRLREQVTILILGVTFAVAILRLVQGPLEPVMKLLAFGVADVAAFQAISFGVVGRSAGSGPVQWQPIVAFGLSWGLHDLFLAAASPAASDLPWIFVGGAAVGLLFGAISWALRQWPGGYLAASAFQFLAVYLVLGFLA